MGARHSGSCMQLELRGAVESATRAHCMHKAWASWKTHRVAGLLSSSVHPAAHAKAAQVPLTPAGV